jgi:glucose/arabinose dehydrogenase
MKKPRSFILKLILLFAAIVVILSIVVGLIGSRRIQSLFHKQLTDAPAPTTVPLPAQATVEGTPSAPPTMAQPTPTPAPVSTPTQPAPASKESPAPSAEVVPTRVIPPIETINLPPGFGISMFTGVLNDPRMMTLGPDGELYVAERGAGRVVRLPDRDDDGVADGVEVIATDLKAPSSIAFYKDGSLYVGETTRILRLSAPNEDGFFQEREVIVDALPSGGHNTRTVLFSSDWSTLFVSIGSSCNVCLEEDERRATIMRYNPDGSGEEIFARGLRNAVGITLRPGTDELWATCNGRDWLGDDLPPETVYVVHEGDDAGWPYCHSGRIVDPDFGTDDSCDGILAPVIEMQAHSAPLGLTFYTGQQFPMEYQSDLFVAFHGSWNRTVPTGYKVIRVPIRDGIPGPVEDFATGWLRDSGTSWGRPVDVLTGSDGSLFISDDSAGAIYRVFYSGE